MEKLPDHIEIPKTERVAELAPEDALPFISVAAISELREIQYTLRNHNRKEAMIAGAKTFYDADRETYSMLDELTKDYLSEFVKDDDGDYGLYTDLIDSVSIDVMSRDRFEKGRKLVDGTWDETEAGWKVVYDTHKTLIEKVFPVVEPTDPDEEPDEDDTPDPVEVAKAEKVALAAEKQAELVIATGNLDAAREALAEAEVQYRTKGMFARKKHSKEQYEALKLAYEEASKVAAVAGFAVLKADREAAEQDPFTPDELNKLAQIAFAVEFGNFVDEQNKEKHMTDYGKNARKFGEVSLKRKVLRVALVLGALGLGQVTGGIFAAGFYGAAAGLRIWQTKSAGTVGHATAKGTDKITRKINRKHLKDTDAIIDLNDTDNTDTLADIIATGHRQVAERTHSSNSRRRKMVPILIGSALVGGALKGLSEYESSKDTFVQIKQNLTNFDWNPFRTHDVTEVIKPPKSGSGLTFSGESTYINEATPTGSGSASTEVVRDSLDNLRPSGSVDIGPELTDLPSSSTGINPATGDLFRSDLSMSVLDGKGFAYDVESAGIVPRGYGVKLAEYLHARGIDNGAHIPGFKDLGMWHTSTGTSVWSTEATRALAEFKAASGL